MRTKMLQIIGVALIVASVIVVAVLVRTTSSRSGLVERTWLPLPRAVPSR